jgi:hypothetical protein
VVPVVVIIVVVVILVLIMRVVMRAVVLAWELNRADVTAARPYPWDIHPALPQLVSEKTEGIACGINGLTGRQQGEMAVARPAVIGVLA